MKWIIFVLILLVIVVYCYAQWPGTRLSPGVLADQIVVLKEQRKLLLLKDGSILKEYRIALGGNPIGHKTQEGDSRTPEGRYIIDYRKPDSAYHRALHISYPNDADRAQAGARGVDPGGLIMIHGLPNGRGIVGRWHRVNDWTLGCIAVTNWEIEEIWQTVVDGTPIDIKP